LRSAFSTIVSRSPDSSFAIGRVALSEGFGGSVSHTTRTISAAEDPAS
jgi:hypothetical protein